MGLGFGSRSAADRRFEEESKRFQELQTIVTGLLRQYSPQTIRQQIHAAAFDAACRQAGAGDAREGARQILTLVSEMSAMARPGWDK